MKFPYCLTLTFAFLVAVAPAQSGRPAGTNVLTHNRYFEKGGIGIINTHLYIDLKASNNEVILDEGKRWTGQDRKIHESVFCFENKVWESAHLPSNFNLSKAIVISFEAGEVRFFDFAKMDGGYYRRLGSSR